MLDAITRPHQLAPHSVEAEEAALGSVLINPDTYHDLKVFLHAADFFIVRNGWVWEAIDAIAERGEGIDNLTVCAELHSQGRLEQVGGAAYIAYLINNTPTHIHAETYGRIVERAAIRRRLLAAASEIAQAALEEDAEIDQVINHAENALYGVTTRRDDQALQPIHSAASKHYDVTEYRMEHRGEPIGIPTGFRKLDELTGGLEPGKLYTIAARPGVGKSALLLNIATNAAKRYQRRVVLFSLEMKAEEIMGRLVASETGIDAQRVKAGALDERQWSTYTRKVNEIANWRIYIDDTSALTIAQMRSKVARLMHGGGIDLVVMDYIQRMYGRDERDVRRNENREREIAFVAQNLKNIAMDYNVPVLSAAQINREVEKRNDKRPMLADLRESGAIEQESDFVAFIYRPADDDKNAELVIRKHRGGPLDSVPLYYRDSILQFTDRS